MSDRTPPKAKQPVKIHKKPITGPKLVESDIKPGIGHNSEDNGFKNNGFKNNGEKHPEVIKLLDEILAYQEQKKAIAKAERDVRNRLKTEFNILASSVSREVSLRKLDPDVRVQVEVNHEDFKKMLGYQPNLDFSGDKPTDASIKAQPSEAKLAERNTEPNRITGPIPVAKGFSVSDDDDEGEEGGVITREG